MFLFEVSESNKTATADLGETDRPKSAEHQVKKSAITSQQEITEVIRWGYRYGIMGHEWIPLKGIKSEVTI